jgi:cytochrome P450
MSGYKDQDIDSGDVPQGISSGPVELSDLPSLRGLPLVGSAVAMRRNISATLERAARLGDVVRIHIGPRRLGTTLVGFFSPSGVQEVLTCRDGRLGKSGPVWTEAARWLGRGLLTSDGPRWARQRRTVSPMFAHAQLTRWQAVLEEEAARMAADVAAAAPATIDLSPPAVRLALRAVGRSVFGTGDLAALEALHHGIGLASVQIIQRASNPLHPPFRFPTPRHVRARRAFDRAFAVADELIAARRRRPGDDLVTLLLQARDATGDPLGHDEIREQALLFLLAGHETTAIGVAAALHQLATNPRLQDEVAADLETSRRAFHEALRLWPPAYWTVRGVRREIVLAGCRLPVGTVVAVSPWVTHRRRELWPDPERFDSDRFTADRVRARSKGSYFPFGLGPQSCIGDRFALLEGTLALSAVCQRVRLSGPGGPARRDLGLTMRPIGLTARVDSRHG